MTTITFTSVPNELKGFFTTNKTYYVDKWGSFSIAVITCDNDDNFYIDIEKYGDFITIN